MLVPRPAVRIFILSCCFVFPSLTQNGGGGGFVNFETALTSPIRLSPDGTRLFCVNNPNATVSVFDVSSNPASPALIAEIPVGMDPVSVNPRSDDEAWVANEESDTVSVISVSKGIVTDTLKAKDEPSDIAFAGSYAFITAARNNLIYVYNATTHALVKTISVFGGSPRQMTVSPDGSTVYAAFAMSGNATTLIPVGLAPAPPPPVNPALPPAPAQGIIVQYNDPSWSSFIKYTMPDNDVVSINASSLTINGYFSGVGTVNLGLTVQPSTGDLFVTNTDALNLTRFQTNLNGHFVTNRVTKITPSGTVTAYDLNPTVAYTGVPDPASLEVALAQPSGVVFDGTGQNMYVAAFGTDRVAKVDTNGNVLSRIEINPQATGATVNPGAKRGPRGLAINNNTNFLYVMNRISNTISVIDTTAGTTKKELRTGSKDPTPAVIRSGRGFLYDAKLSGNGTGSCASCHVDGEVDHLAWDLGDPTGSLFPVTLNTGAAVDEHPMKGPMMTMTMRGLVKEAPYHWRGDKIAFSNFNEAFQLLMGGNQLSTNNMTAYTNFVNTIAFMPNPYQNLDRTYPTSLEGGNAQTGQTDFSTFVLTSPKTTCNSCHLSTNFGSNLQLVILGQENQPMKNTLLRMTYQKQLFSRTGQTIDGFGMFHDGSEVDIHTFLAGPLFPLLQPNTTAQNDIAAFNLSIDTGTAPAVGYSETLTSKTVSNSTYVANWATLESQAAVNCDLLAEGAINGQTASLLFSPTSASYSSTTAGVGPFTHAQLVSAVQSGSTVTVMGVPFGSGSRMTQRASAAK